MRAILAAIAFVVIAVAYMSFFYPWPSTSDVQGTIGGVKKYNASQMGEKDVTLASPQNEGARRINEAFSTMDANQKATAAKVKEILSQVFAH